MPFLALAPGLPTPTRPAPLLIVLALAGIVAFSIHVGMLAMGVPFPRAQPPLLMQWLNEGLVAAGVLAFVVFARPALDAHRPAARLLLVAFTVSAIQETVRAGVMTGVVTGGWVHALAGLVRPIVRVLLLAQLCLVASRWTRGIGSLAMLALPLGAISLAARKSIALLLEPVMQSLAWLARPELYVFPYPVHVMVAAYATFAEAVLGAALLTLLVWDRLPPSKTVRIMGIALLVALIKGVVGGTLLYSASTATSWWVGAWSWSQFLLEFLVLGALVALAWNRYGARATTTR